MKQPFKGYFRISQYYGQNLNDFYKKSGLLGHTGVDFAMPIGTPIISPVNGVVTALSTDIQKGLGITILSTDKFQWSGQECLLTTIYWHLSHIDVKIGDKVKLDQQIGLSGNTGKSTGPHLHFSIAPMDLKGKRMLSSRSNGYRGHIDPLTYLELENTSNKMKELQELLNKYGANLIVDGKFGPRTQQALTNFVTQ